MKTKKLSTLMIIDDDKDLLDLLCSFFKQRGYNVVTYEDARLALDDIESSKVAVDVVLSDFKLPVMSGVDFIKRIRKINLVLPIILMTAEGSLEVSLEAIEAGAYDFVLKPLHFPQLLISVQRALFLNQVQIENTNLKSLFNEQDFLGLKGVIGRSPGFKQAMELAKRVSSSQANIIISGESGSGKEVVARAVHELGERKNQPFIAINCSAIPENLLESELFGYAKGAFTGAMGSKIGLFEEANNGTLFLDEIGDLALPLQAKLLRVLQERKIKRIGENQPRDITARIICATHKNLKKEVEAGRFREDLYFRLNVIPIYMPPLRDRKEDILPLSEYFLKKFSLMNNVSIKGFTKEAIKKLETLPWQGNVRELENAIERAVVLAQSDYIEPDDLPSTDHSSEEKKIEGSVDGALFSINSLMTLEDVCKKYIEFIFKRNNFAKEQTAKELDIDRKTLYRKLKEIESYELN
ncbi:sigma-54-dependent Fis family transcriptional regulator [Bacteriovorax stolpii]|uniref:Sigma-54-dependent Fis family transcriptional regulator n=1 Tax=Bacteriovorax stolpii TaxID=960 RepID=A0A2K9NUG5_BACTC|nr:sigma-54 dependent transcriptional regulator [Bacteriovorax stolpii]AUN99159.1 sigma-54-dependent Fis family transcriptional regulator [Bacteriovorax stolpii]QDK40859.1 sigma-54-dependent Fis family transcriptional regulator [Bacteriovorax stolpii]TDP55305.1 two-component system response regulator HydG/two-component system response regulator AtoC [Bacteriovorax stolpii]